MQVRDRGILKRKSSGVGKNGKPYAMCDVATMGRTVNLSVTMEQFGRLPGEESEVDFTGEEEVGYEGKPRYKLLEMKVLKPAGA